VSLSLHYLLLVPTACLIGHANQYADRLGRQWPELFGRILRRFPYRRGPPAHQRHFVRFLSRDPGAPRSFGLGGHQHPPEHALYPKHAAGERARDPRAVLDRIDTLTIPSHAASPIIHIHLRTATPSLTVAAAKAANPAMAAPGDALSFDIAGEECPLQNIVDDYVLAQGVWITRARRLRGQELVESRPSIRPAVTAAAALSRKESERIAGVIKAAVTKCSRSEHE
jgi:hypothetical protein